VLGWLAAGGHGTRPNDPRGRWRRVLAGLAVGGMAVATCLPWTLRNCERMERCALVSVNGGWNLLIGAQTDSGAWTEVAVPVECREVWSEAGKDTCFERAARRDILRAPRSWLGRIPAKLAATFDYFGAAPWYLHLANGSAFPESAKVALGALETLVARLLLVGAHAAVARLAAPRARLRAVVAGAGALVALVKHAWPSYLALVLAIVLLGPRAWRRSSFVVPFTGALVALTAVTHAVFFGAGRYGLVAAPFVALVAFVARHDCAQPDEVPSSSR